MTSEELLTECRLYAPDLEMKLIPGASFRRSEGRVVRVEDPTKVRIWVQWPSSPEDVEEALRWYGHGCVGPKENEEALKVSLLTDVLSRLNGQEDESTG